MSDCFDIRRATEDELPKAMRLFQGILNDLPYYNDMAKDNERKKYSLLKLATRQAEDPYSVLVAVAESGEMVGFCFNHMDDFTVWIDWFGVVPSVRRRGIGLRVLNTVVETAQTRGVHKVWCDCRTSNEPSKKLLRKAGFRELVEIKNHWYGQDFILWEQFV